MAPSNKTRSYSFALLYLQNFYRVSEGISKILLAGGPEQKKRAAILLSFCTLKFYRVSQGIAGIILAGGPEKTRSYLSAFLYFKISRGSLKEILQFL